MLLFFLLIFSIFAQSFQFPGLESYLDKQTRVTVDQNLYHYQSGNQYENPPDDENESWSAVLPILPVTRIDFGIFKNIIPREWTFTTYKAYKKTTVRPIHSQIHYTQWNVFRLMLGFLSEYKANKGGTLFSSADLHDTNFPCNDADEKTVKSWAHNGRQVMYSVYFDEVIDDKVYVFVNINDDICEYHINYADFNETYKTDTRTVPFKRFKGLRLTAPEGYKIVHPLMSVDTAMRTLNYVVISRAGPVDLKLISYRFHSQGHGKPLRWEEYDAKADLLPRFQEQQFYGEDGNGDEKDYHRLEFLRRYDFRVHQGSCPKEYNGLMSSLGCVHFFSVFYKGNEVYDLIGMPARKIPCKVHPAKKAPKHSGVERNVMFLEASRCKTIHSYEFSSR